MKGDDDIKFGYNVVGTWDGSNIKIYVDGVERGSEASSGSVQSVTNANWIGRYSTSSYMDGNLSNIAYWKNTVLTQSEIAEIYNAGVPILALFTGLHDDYHTPRDTIDKIDYTGLEKVSKYLRDLTTATANLESAPDYIKVKR